MTGAGERTDLYYFDLNGEKQKKKNVEIINTFLFSRIDFFLTKDKGLLEVSFCKDGELYSIYQKHEKEYTPSEVMRMFRDNFTKFGCNQEMIENFLQNPLKYKKKKKKSTSNKPK